MFEKIQVGLSLLSGFFKNMIIRIKPNSESSGVIRSYSNIIRRVLVIFFSCQWSWLLYISAEQYCKNGDLGDNWTKLMLGVVGVLTVILGFYFGGRDVDKIKDVATLAELNSSSDSEALVEPKKKVNTKEDS